jgi:hypothetical protein
VLKDSTFMYRPYRLHEQKLKKNEHKYVPNKIRDILKGYLKLANTHGTKNFSEKRLLGKFTIKFGNQRTST